MSMLQYAAIIVAIILLWPKIKPLFEKLFVFIKSQIPSFPQISLPQVKLDGPISSIKTSPVVPKSMLDEDKWFELLRSYKSLRDELKTHGNPEAIKILDQVFPMLKPNGDISI